MSAAVWEILDHGPMIVKAGPDRGGDMADSGTWDGTRYTHKAEHQIDVNAPAQRVYGMIADVEKWPNMVAATVHGVQAELEGDTELIRMWSVVNGVTRIWTSRRRHDPDTLTVRFYPQKFRHPIGGMVGAWVVEPVTGETCRLRLLHEYFPATDDPADLDWIVKALDRSGTVDLGAVKAAAEAIGTGAQFTFADTVEVEGTAQDVYDFLHEAGSWQERLPHVTRVSLEEETPGMQVVEMDTEDSDGTVHTTTSVRVGEPHRRIVHKQIDPPGLMKLHTGRWLIEESGPGTVSVTSEHTVRIDEERITAVLGEGADLAAAKDFVRESLSAEASATLDLARSYAEARAGGR
jgi:aromatase